MKHYYVTAAILINNGEILCMQRGPSKYEYVAYKYEFPGGKVEESESLEACLQRELMEVDYQLHAKGYIFRKDDTYNLIVGSSNMTQDALYKNKEWNLKVTSTNKGTLIQETLLEFEETFNHAQVVDSAWIEAYKTIYQRVQYQDINQSDNNISENNLTYQVNTIQNIPRIMPNTMQVQALLGIEAIRAKHKKKALLISATLNKYILCIAYSN